MSTPVEFVREIKAAEHRLGHTLPVACVQFMKDHAGELVPFDTTPHCGLWLSPEELIPGNLWGLESIGEMEDASVHDLVVLHHSHLLDHLLVLDYHRGGEPAVLGLARTPDGWSVGLRLASFAAFVQALDRQAALAETFLKAA
jgi:hypothetical protein